MLGLSFNAFAAAASPTSRPAVSEQAWQLLSDGKQGEAEHLLSAWLDMHGNDAHNLFLLGVLTRSRFESDEAAVFFREAIEKSASPDEVAAAQAVMTLDARGDDDKPFSVLRDLVKSHPDEPAYVWLVAVECRNYHHNEEGAAAFEALGKQFKTGPVLFHQTYANILDELKRYDQSLPHRKMAVMLEPQWWSLSGLADTYVRMGDPKDAEQPYEQAMAMRPNNPSIQFRLTNVQITLGEAEKAVASAKTLVRLAPQRSYAYIALGNAYGLHGDFSLAADAFIRAYHMDPHYTGPWNAAVKMLHKAGRDGEVPALQAEAH